MVKGLSKKISRLVVVSSERVSEQDEEEDSNLRKIECLSPRGEKGKRSCRWSVCAQLHVKRDHFSRLGIQLACSNIAYLSYSEAVHQKF